MHKKHPTLGKRTLARMYFLETTENKAIVESNKPSTDITEDMEITPTEFNERSKRESFIKFLNNV